MKGAVYNNGVLTGYLEKTGNGYLFRYTDNYYQNKENPPISLTLPKTKQQYESDTLFAFFQGLLSEGVNKDIQCRLLKIDENDDFTRLLQTAGDDTIGAITVKPVDDDL
jgi:HipA-like protein